MVKDTGRSQIVYRMNVRTREEDVKMNSIVNIEDHSVRAGGTAEKARRDKLKIVAGRRVKVVNR